MKGCLNLLDYMSLFRPHHLSPRFLSILRPSSPRLNSPSPTARCEGPAPWLPQLSNTTGPTGVKRAASSTAPAGTAITVATAPYRALVTNGDPAFRSSVV